MKRVDYIAYTDGGYIIPKGYGAAACVIMQEGSDEPFFKWAKVCRHSTNNRQEMGAIIRAVLTIPDGASIRIHTDSQYAIGALGGTQRQTNKNKDLIDYYCQVVMKKRIHVEFRWVRGHNGNFWNEYVDGLCSEAIEKYEQTGEVYMF